MSKTDSLPLNVKQYLLITGNYWAFTLTDGALRMLVVLHFHHLGYSPISIAFLFLFYEMFGIITNLAGGYLGARIGLNRTMNIGLAMQVIALIMLASPSHLLTFFWVMVAQALSGIAKDLNKMSAKSAVKMLLPKDQQGQLFKWVALLTGSKNALKGVGFFLGGALLALLGFKWSVITMAGALAIIWLASMLLLKRDLGKAKNKPKFTDLFSKNRAINILSAARLFLFGARDLWFVVALPVFLSAQLNWDFWWVGAFLACWVMGYGIVQSAAPSIINSISNKSPDGRTALWWAIILALVTASIAALINSVLPVSWVLIGGLFLFGVVFAINSSLHSYLILNYAREDGISMDVGFYYMANATGRLTGTLLSGWIYQDYGFASCLWVSTAFIIMTVMLSTALPRTKNHI
jgi:predicted MFS family arabinose efflux permease